MLEAIWNILFMLCITASIYFVEPFFTVFDYINEKLYECMFQLYFKAAAAAIFTQLNWLHHSNWMRPNNNHSFIQLVMNDVVVVVAVFILAFFFGFMYFEFQKQQFKFCRDDDDDYKYTCLTAQVLNRCLLCAWNIPSLRKWCIILVNLDNVVTANW